MDVVQPALTWVGWPKMKNLLWLACKFDLDQIECKSTQVHASPGQTESQVDPSFKLASPFGQGWIENSLLKVRCICWTCHRSAFGRNREQCKKCPYWTGFFGPVTISGLYSFSIQSWWIFQLSTPGKTFLLVSSLVTCVQKSTDYLSLGKKWTEGIHVIDLARGPYCWNIGRVLFRRLVNQAACEVHKPARKERDQHSPIRT